MPDAGYLGCRMSGLHAFVVQYHCWLRWRQTLPMTALAVLRREIPVHLVARDDGADSGEADEARFSPDGTRLISYGRNQDLRLWDVTSRETLVTFAGQRSGEGQAAFMPDGLRFVAASDSRLNVYPATIEQFLVRGCDMLRHRSAFAQVEAVCPAPRRDGDRITEATSSAPAR